jgi:hypothetical protein
MSEKFIPPTPNLAGDNVRFVVYTDGKPASWGHMHKSNIQEIADKGTDIRIVDESWQPPPPKLPDPKLLLQAEVFRALEQTDKYFTTDATDNIDGPTQAQWRQYRKALRDAVKKDTPQDVVAGIPSSDPKGNDPFKKFR